MRLCVCVCIHTIRSIRSYTYCRKRHLYIILIYYARILERFPSTNVVHATPVVRNIAVAGRPHLHTDFPGTFSAGDRTAQVLSLCCKKGFSYVPKLSKSLQAQPYRESTLITQRLKTYILLNPKCLWTPRNASKCSEFGFLRKQLKM